MESQAQIAKISLAGIAALLRSPQRRDQLHYRVYDWALRKNSESADMRGKLRPSRRETRWVARDASVLRLTRFFWRVSRGRAWTDGLSFKLWTAWPSHQTNLGIGIKSPSAFTRGGIVAIGGI